MAVNIPANEDKKLKIDRIKSYLDDLNNKLTKAVSESSSKMKEVVKKKEEEKVKELLDELKNM